MVIKKVSGSIRPLQKDFIAFAFYKNLNGFFSWYSHNKCVLYSNCVDDRGFPVHLAFYVINLGLADVTAMFFTRKHVR